eukprot:TRINITY_DN679_c0_g1_i1.p4 TRINITY_DN679_c0_g1~~TRINITY_DN679_c0_g1_i1.p4  ORF type:complete len:110 (+),score=46.71 TRINITY_DN679_c0_g1_i1:55-384(+)
MGVTLKKIVEGDGKTYPKKGQIVTVDYTARLEGAAEPFDSTKRREKDFKFRLRTGEVIPGWDEGVAQMSLQERSEITLTPDVAYGGRGFPGLIPPHTTIVFEVWLKALA